VTKREVDTVTRTYRHLLAGFERSVGHDPEIRWRWLEAAHVVGQRNLRLHAASHVEMLRFALSLGNWSEIAGQLFRLTLVPLGHLSGRLPLGNTGRATVSAFRRITPDPDTRELIRTARLEEAPALNPRRGSNVGSAGKQI